MNSLKNFEASTHIIKLNFNIFKKILIELNAGILLG
jgi:hypothetical protein